ncbi:hypothetical protein GCM10010124_32620 [Pilimelia terevasa]|uniref:Uncharacterized protein n=1 Tax=Pilimelia terevasa TaxID=53372 RepID=A0A8J3BUK4_9ACTN|nr:hypothetical protein [Pilimelia terevasa]GGK37348.1 hypothetical protein GCM10010124_32620 [Pilimelia terevasa]
MATRVDAGLTADDLDTLRSALAAGRRPKVMFTEAAGQIVGQFGQVAAVEEADGETTVVVRFGRDELPFTPADVVIPPRGAASAAKKAAGAPVTEQAAPPAPSGPPLLPPAPRAAPPAPAAGPEAAEVRPRRPKAAKVKPAAGVTVTLSYVEGEWSVAAAAGSRTLARPCAVRAAEALRVVRLLDVPALSEAVEQIVAAERSRAQERAERLRAELAEVEARLAELPAGA